MEQVRRINPRAKFLQTEDFGKAYASPELQYQADFENERRWLTFDLLRGRWIGTIRSENTFSGWVF